jgi:hypothetical protein
VKGKGKGKGKGRGRGELLDASGGAKPQPGGWRPAIMGGQAYHPTGQSPVVTFDGKGLETARSSAGRLQSGAGGRGSNGEPMAAAKAAVLIWHYMVDPRLQSSFQ